MTLMVNAIATLGLSCLAGSALMHDSPHPAPRFEARGAAESSPFPTDAHVLQVLDESIDSEGDGVGIVVGLVTRESSRVFRYAKILVPDQRREHNEAVFKLGSVTYVLPPARLKPITTRSLTSAWTAPMCPSAGVHSTSREVVAYLSGFIDATGSHTNTSHPMAVAFELRRLASYNGFNRLPTLPMESAVANSREPPSGFSCAMAFDATRGIGLTVATTSDDGAQAIAARLLQCTESHCPAALGPPPVDQSVSRH